MIAIFVSNYGMVLELQGIRSCIRGGKKLISASEDVSGAAGGCPQSAESAVSRL